MGKVIKLKEILNEYGKKTSELVGTPKKVFGRVYQMKDLLHQDYL